MMLRFIPVYFETMASNLGQLWDDLVLSLRSFSVLGVLDAIVRYVTLLPFTPVIAIVNTLGDTLIKNGRQMRSFVVTGDDLVRFVVNYQREAFINVGQLGNTSVFDLVLSWLAQMVWNVVTKSTILNRIFRLAKVRSLEDLVKIFRSSALKHLWLIVARTLLAYFALGVAMISLVMFGLSFGSMFDKVRLAQDAKRQWRKTGYPRRVNSRRGPDS